ncbi:MAG: ferritin-like domain-containing protein, partial [Kofleriaceae bacterium]
CAAVSQRSNIQSCDVEHRATEHEVTYSYTHYSSESGCPVEGRRPPGLRPHARTRGSKVAAHLARSAYHEAASVHAFVDIARQLMRHGAPRSLIRAAQRSAVDEVAHAQAMTELARQRGAQPSRVLVAKPRRRSLEALAIENAREGLVGETWAAMVACWQARQAPSRELRATYAKIAHDELAHAELAVAIDAWARSRLSPAARRRVGQARDRAVTQLARGARRGPDRELVDALGMPSAVEMQQLFANARARLWA